MRTVRQIGIGWGLVVAFFFALNQSVVSEEKQADKPWSMRVRYNLQQPLPFCYSDSVGITARVLDWDGDSDYDLMVGWLAGRVIFCENTGSNKSPKFRTEFLTSQGETFRVDFTAGCSAGVWVYDWDGDGMLDLLGGGDCGWLFAYDGHLFDQH